jgi:hypothetical protein
MLRRKKMDLPKVVTRCTQRIDGLLGDKAEKPADYQGVRGART